MREVSNSAGTFASRRREVDKKGGVGLPEGEEEEEARGNEMHESEEEEEEEQEGDQGLPEGEEEEGVRGNEMLESEEEEGEEQEGDQGAVESPASSSLNPATSASFISRRSPAQDFNEDEKEGDQEGGDSDSSSDSSGSESSDSSPDKFKHVVLGLPSARYIKQLKKRTWVKRPGDALDYLTILYADYQRASCKYNFCSELFCPRL
jgi:hypothetical protein